MPRNEFVSLAIWFTLGCAHVPPKDERGIGVFTKLDEIDDVKISPDGSLIAVSAPGSLTFLDTETLTVKKSYRFEEGDFERKRPQIGAFMWVGNDMLVLELVESFGGIAEPAFTGE